MSAIIRRIQVVGNRSYSVSLPKHWVTDTKLDSTRFVNMQIRGNSLILSAAPIEKLPTMIDILIDKPDLISHTVLLCYTKGVSELIVRFPNKTQALQSKTHLSEILSRLDGFTITDETDLSVTITAVYTRSEITIAKIARRMVSILDQMIACIQNEDVHPKNILENEMDALYHLSNRILSICSTDLETRERNALQDMEAIFLWRMIFKKIENIADVLESIKNVKPETIDMIMNVLSPLKDTYILNRKLEQRRIASLSSLDIRAQDARKVSDLVLDVLNTHMLITLNTRYFSMP